MKEWRLATSKGGWWNAIKKNEKWNWKSEYGNGKIEASNQQRGMMECNYKMRNGIGKVNMEMEKWRLATSKGGMQLECVLGLKIRRHWALHFHFNNSPVAKYNWEIHLREYSWEIQLRNKVKKYSLEMHYRQLWDEMQQMQLQCIADEHNIEVQCDSLVWFGIHWIPNQLYSAPHWSIRLLTVLYDGSWYAAILQCIYLHCIERRTF